MTRAKAVKEIAAILVQLPATGVDLEEVLYAAQRLVRYERDLGKAQKDWPAYNEERAEEGKPALSWREYLLECKAGGEWEWPITSRPPG